MMLQKKLAARAAGCSPYRVRFDVAQMDSIKEAITTFDVRRLINTGAITILPKTGTARGRHRVVQGQRRKGRRRNMGSRKGRKTARTPGKEAWMMRIRAQREMLRELREKSLISNGTYRTMYDKARGGFFRSRRHLKVYLEEQDLFRTKQ